MLQKRVRTAITMPIAVVRIRLSDIPQRNTCSITTFIILNIYVLFDLCGVVFDASGQGQQAETLAPSDHTGGSKAIVRAFETFSAFAAGRT
jgi:hypothetical protein